MIRRDKYTQQSKQSEIFSDFLLDFNRNPDTGDLFRNSDLLAIQSSIKNLMLTDRGERLFQPDIGSNIRHSLFELVGTNTQEILQQYIEDTIKQHEPRAKYVSSTIVPSEDTNSIAIHIQFSTINRPGTIENVSILLTRVR